MRVVLMPNSSSSSSSVLPPCRTVPEEADLHFKPTLEDHAVPPADHTTGRPSYGWVPPRHVPWLCPSISAELPQQESAAFSFLKNTLGEASRSLPLCRNRQNKNYSHKIIPPPPEQIETYFKIFPLSFYEGHSCPRSGYYPAHKKE